MTDLRTIPIVTFRAAPSARAAPPARKGSSAAPAAAASGAPPHSATHTAETRLRQASAAQVQGQGGGDPDGDDGAGGAVAMPSGAPAKESEPERGGPKGAARAAAARGWKPSRQVAGGSAGSGAHGDGGSGAACGAQQDEGDKEGNEEREHPAGEPPVAWRGRRRANRMILRMAAARDAGASGKRAAADVDGTGAGCPSLIGNIPDTENTDGNHHTAGQI